MTKTKNYNLPPSLMGGNSSVSNWTSVSLGKPWKYFTRTNFLATTIFYNNYYLTWRRYVQRKTKQIHSSCCWPLKIMLSSRLSNMFSIFDCITWKRSRFIELYTTTTWVFCNWIHLFKNSTKAISKFYFIFSYSLYILHT